MNIALLTYSTKPRGSVVHTWELATALHQLGHAVAIYALDKDGQGCNYSLPCGFYGIPAGPPPAALDDLIRQRIQEFVDFLGQVKETYDVYHAQDCIGANALVQLRQQGIVPHVVRTVHHVEDYASPYLRQCQDTSIRQADLCLCVSDRWQRALAQDYSLAAMRVVNGVNQDRFSPHPQAEDACLRATYGLTGHPIYLTVGGIEPRKNSIALLAAFAQVRSQYPQAQLVIAGGATLFDYQPYRDQFFQQLASLGLAVGTDLILPGVVPDAELPGLYRSADVFCFPSVKEGWGLVVLEAIAAGLPVVTANEPPFTEFLAPDQALLVPPQSVPALAQAMVAAAQPTQAQALVQHSQTLLSQYTWQTSARQHLAAYQSL
ncbi:MSMEG_0565 family glycosyltransferase [Nodosilinea sp. P-1105]|uniref:MSMEG_0565 family glycosyltransferase n=1 Tax=Nodosilinea sp. P-1105 TaxID=2546229 RepID=UPI00146F2377|nr:MSMEG_0565 family glycosyltransferase [Nodosilinea sp. P-1105]NMF82480.1 MSMEG_0565 family glycosyltransferase [Nodosilinea sp. P-1105]